MTLTRADLPPAARLEGPFTIGRGDIAPLNVLFSETFTERYRRDGLTGVRVPPLNPAIWRYAILDAGDGAMLWRDARGAIAAFNIAHRSGVEGWMGPLAVRGDRQGSGRGKLIVRAGMEMLKRSGCRVIGLETMPRTMDNIGFYASLGFLPERLTLTLTVDAAPQPHAPCLLSTLRAGARDSAVRECAALVDAVLPGFDYTREIELTHELALGDTLLMYEHDTLEGFALCHSAPLVEGRASEELRLLKAVVRTEGAFDRMVTLLADVARRAETARVAIRLQGDYSSLLQRLFAAGARVRWTDLRMVLAGFEDRPPKFGVALSNWEI